MEKFHYPKTINYVFVEEKDFAEFIGNIIENSNVELSNNPKQDILNSKYQL